MMRWAVYSCGRRVDELIGIGNTEACDYARRRWGGAVVVTNLDAPNMERVARGGGRQ